MSPNDLFPRKHTDRIEEERAKEQRKKELNGWDENALKVFIGVPLVMLGAVIVGLFRGRGR